METYNSIKDIEDNIEFAKCAKSMGTERNIDPFFYQMIRKGKMKSVPEILAKSYRKQKTYSIITSWWKENDVLKD